MNAIKELEDEELVLEEKIETLKFFQMVCNNKRINFDHIKNNFAFTKTKLIEAEAKGVSDITTVPADAHYE